MAVQLIKSRSSPVKRVKSISPATIEKNGKTFLIRQYMSYTKYLSKSVTNLSFFLLALKIQTHIMGKSGGYTFFWPMYGYVMS